MAEKEKRKCPYCNKGGPMTHKQYVEHYRKYHKKITKGSGKTKWARFHKPGGKK